MPIDIIMKLIDDYDALKSNWDSGNTSQTTPHLVYAARQALQDELTRILTPLPTPVHEPDAFLHDDGCWTVAKTDAGRALNNRLHFAGSPKVAVYTSPQAKQPAQVQMQESESYGGQMPDTVTKLMELVDSCMSHAWNDGVVSKLGNRFLSGRANTARQALEVELTRLFTPLTDDQIATVYFGATGQSLRSQDNHLAHKFAKAMECQHGITGETK